MKRKWICIVLVGFVVAFSYALIQSHGARAQCGDPAYPCPPDSEKEKKPKPAAPDAPTPVSTETPSCPIGVLWPDADGDTFGEQYKLTIGGMCNIPEGYTTQNGDDCNDGDAAIHPGAIDTCGDGVDQDCSGSDEVCSSGLVAPVASPCAGQGCGPSIPAPPFPAWLLGGGILLLGILVGFLLPRKFR